MSESQDYTILKSPTTTYKLSVPPCLFCYSNEHLDLKFSELTSNSRGVNQQRCSVHCSSCGSTGPSVAAEGSEIKWLPEMAWAAWGQHETLGRYSE